MTFMLDDYFFGMKGEKKLFIFIVCQDSHNETKKIIRTFDNYLTNKAGS